MAYTTAANVAARMGISTLSAEQTTYFNDVVSGAVDTIINTRTGTVFGNTAISDVYVSGEDSQFLTIPTMYDISAVAEVDDLDQETGISVDEYVTYPRNETSKYALRKLSGEWNEGFDNYKITGKLGYASVPDDIELVATELAAAGIDQMTGAIESEKVGDWSATYAKMEQGLSSDSKAILSNYRRLSRSL